MALPLLCIYMVVPAQKIVMRAQYVVVAGAGSKGGEIAKTCARAGIEAPITSAVEQALER